MLFYILQSFSLPFLCFPLPFFLFPSPSFSGRFTLLSADWQMLIGSNSLRVDVKLTSSSTQTLCGAVIICVRHNQPHLDDIRLCIVKIIPDLVWTRRPTPARTTFVCTNITGRVNVKSSYFLNVHKKNHQ